jgi:hypothetical protein
MLLLYCEVKMNKQQKQHQSQFLVPDFDEAKRNRERQPIIYPDGMELTEESSKELKSANRKKRKEEKNEE